MSDKSDTIKNQVPHRDVVTPEEDTTDNKERTKAVENGSKEQEQDEQLKSEFRGLKHDCERNIRYHKARNHFYECGTQTVMAIILILSSGATWVFIEEYFALSWVILTLPSAVIGSLMAVFRPVTMACLHKQLAIEFNRIDTSLENTHLTIDELKSLKEQLNKLYEQEPPVYHALNALCRNEADQALGYEEKRHQRLPKWKQRLRHFFRFSSTDFPLKNHQQT